VFRKIGAKKLERDSRRPNVAWMQEKVQTPDSQNEAQAGEKSLEELLAEAQAKIEQQRDAMLRAVAESDNARKRAQAEAATGQKYAVERFAESLLPVIDSLEAALAAQDASKAMREGVELTLRQLKAAFQKAHLSEINPALGERFDPHRHQAMTTVPSEGEPNTIASVMQKGYGLHDRVVRPALVTVTKALENGDKNPTSDKDLD
jgi:molecular chaperone GrpE